MLVGLVDSTRSCVLTFTPRSCSRRSTLIAYVVTVVVSPSMVRATVLRALTPNASVEASVNETTHAVTRTRRSVTNLRGVHLLVIRPLSSDCLHRRHCNGQIGTNGMGSAGFIYTATFSRKRNKGKGGRREGDVLPPVRTRQVGGSLVRSPEAISWGKASGSLTHGKRSKPVETGFEPPVGIEPTTCRLQGGRSGHLS